MSRLSLFDSPLFLGFDHFEQTFDRLKKNASEGYPPYNIEQIGDNGLRITLAVAGFTMEDLDVELDQNQLTVRGRIQENDPEEEARVFLHRGIAARQFQRTFVLADGIEILGASLDKGLLHIDMQHRARESSARKIEISSSSHKGRISGSADAIDIESVGGIDHKAKQRSKDK